MPRILILIACIGALASCSARTRPPVDVDAAPILYINHALQDDAQICVPRAVFLNDGMACITVGELRRQLRRGRDVALEARP